MSSNPEIIAIDKTNWPTDVIVHWVPTNMCNYDCSYCSPKDHLEIDVKKYKNIELLISATDKVRRAIPEDKTIKIVITGGEPFLIPHVNQWLDRIVYHKIIFTIFTNGSLPFHLYEKCLPALIGNHVRISFHPERASVDSVVKLSRLLVDAGVNVEIRGMLVPTLFDRVYELSSKLEMYGITVHKLPVFPLMNNKTRHINMPFNSSRKLLKYSQVSDLNLPYFSDEERDKLKTIHNEAREKRIAANLMDARAYQEIVLTVKSADGQITSTKSSAKELMLAGINRFSGWQCDVVRKKLCISENGDITYGICNNTGVVGNIFTDSKLTFLNTYTICKQEACMLHDELMIKKSKIL